MSVCTVLSVMTFAAICSLLLSNPTFSYSYLLLFASSISCSLSDSCKPQSARLCLKAIRVLCISGCQLDKALRIIKNNNCLQGPWVVQIEQIQIWPAGALW